MYIARRLVRMAIEDIGLADPRALEQAVACMQAVHFLGIPEGDLALAQAAIYLAVAPKSGRRLSRARPGARGRAEDPGRAGADAFAQCADAAMKQWGYGEGYQHAHKFEDAITEMECLPPSLAGRRYYVPTDRGMEKRIAERLEEIRKAKEKP